VSVSAPEVAADQPIDACPLRAYWSLPGRILFRFAFVYFVLSSVLPLAMALSRTFGDAIVTPLVEQGWAALSVWAVSHVFGVTDFNSRYLGGDSIVQFAALLLPVLCGGCDNGLDHS
jgi:hypothetical protein